MPHAVTRVTEIQPSASVHRTKGLKRVCLKSNLTYVMAHVQHYLMMLFVSNLAFHGALCCNCEFFLFHGKR